MKVIALSLLCCVTALNSRCQYGAVISSHLVEASVLSVEGNIVVRARLGDNAYLAEGLQCLEGGRANLTGIQWQILQPGPRGTNCTGASVFGPAADFVIPGGSQSVPGYQCTPELYESNPWSCVPGDLSGKFGSLDLGLHELLGELKKYRFLANSGTDADVLVDKLAHTLSHSRVSEEQHMFGDRLPIPPCQIEGKLLGVFCADGRLAGCASFYPLEPAEAQLKHPWEAALRFVTNYPPPPACPAPRPCPVSTDKGAFPRDKSVPADGWTDRIGKEIGKVPDYVSSWWEDVKRKSREAWRSQL